MVEYLVSGEVEDLSTVLGTVANGTQTPFYFFMVHPGEEALESSYFTFFGSDPSSPPVVSTQDGGVMSLDLVQLERASDGPLVESIVGVGGGLSSTEAASSAIRIGVNANISPFIPLFLKVTVYNPAIASPATTFWSRFSKLLWTLRFVHKIESIQQLETTRQIQGSRYAHEQRTGDHTGD